MPNLCGEETLVEVGGRTVCKPVDVEEAGAQVNATTDTQEQSARHLRSVESLSAGPVLRSWGKKLDLLRQIPSDEVACDLYVQAVQFAQPVNDENADKEEEQAEDQPAEQVGKMRGRPAMTADEKTERFRKRQEDMNKTRVGHTGPTLLGLFRKKK
jgi:hypothetical protein